MKKIGFIGTGTMAKSIINGLVHSSFGAELYGYDLYKNNYEFLLKCGVNCCSSSKEIIRICDFVVLSVKPQNMAEVLTEIRPYFNKSVVLVSIAAGVDEKFVVSILGKEIKFIRVMPNTPLLLGKGAVAVSRGINVDDESFVFVKKMFEIGGVVCEIDSSQMNDIVAINGSSPAFIYLFTKGFLSFADKRGIKADVALKLFCASLVGSAAMMESSNKAIDELISDVSSKGGTTVAGLSVLNDSDLIGIVEKTCEKTAKRAFELSN